MVYHFKRMFQGFSGSIVPICILSIMLLVCGCSRGTLSDEKKSVEISSAEDALSKVSQDVLEREERLAQTTVEGSSESAQRGLTAVELSIREFEKSFSYSDFKNLMLADPELAIKVTSSWPDMYAVYWTDITLEWLEKRDYPAMRVIVEKFTFDTPYEPGNWILTTMINEIRFFEDVTWQKQSGSQEEFVDSLCKYLAITGRIRVQELDQFNPSLVLTERQRSILRQSEHSDMRELAKM